MLPPWTEPEHVDRAGPAPMSADRRGPRAPRAPWPPVPRRARSSPQAKPRRQHRGVRASRAVRGPAGVARARESRPAARRRRTRRWPTHDARRSRRPPGTRARGSSGPARQGRRARAARRSPPARAPRARWECTTVTRGSRSSTSAAWALSVQQRGARLGDHDRVEHDGRLVRELVERLRDRSDRRLVAEHADLHRVDADVAEPPRAPEPGSSRHATAMTAVTPTVFCAVSAVIAVMPCTPQAANALRSAWMPAPPPESEPAIDSTRGMRGACVTGGEVSR